MRKPCAIEKSGKLCDNRIIMSTSIFLEQPLLFEVQPALIFPKPFLKWAGGKSQLLEQFAPFFPKEFSRYSEPFTGSAAVYWHLFTLRERGAIKFHETRLSDSNAELINCYQSIRDDVSLLIEKLAQHRDRHEKAYYYRIRSLDVTHLTSTERAARFIYLNKTSLPYIGE